MAEGGGGRRGVAYLNNYNVKKKRELEMEHNILIINEKIKNKKERVMEDSIGDF